MNDLLKEIVVKIAQERNFEFPDSIEELYANVESNLNTNNNIKFNIKAKYIDNNKNEEN